ncbi:MAG: helix-turn-helix transcriptional regulator [Patescibacteria group bacterium]
MINKLIHYRTTKGLTQEDLAEKLGVTRQTIIAIEKGNYTPSLLLALKVSGYFKVSVEKIFNLK